MRTISYFYSAYSAFAYLGSARLNAISASANCPIKHKPIDLNRCIAAAGVSGFGQRTKAHADYFFGQEINRWSEYRNAPVLGRIPTHHANDPILANGMLIAADLQGLSVDLLAHEMLQAHWRDDADLADRKTLLEIAESAGYEPQPLLDAASTQAVLDVYENNTDEAIRQSVFGSPTYFINDEMFYGQDRLEFVERRLAKQ